MAGAQVRRYHGVDRALAELLSSSIGVEAAAVVSTDGLPMASALPASMQDEQVAAMSASMHSLGERAMRELRRGTPQEIFVQGDDGAVCLVSCGDAALLVAIADHEAKVGLVLYEVRRAAALIAGALTDRASEPAGEREPARADSAIDTRNDSAGPHIARQLTEPVMPNDEPWGTYARAGTVAPDQPPSWP
jgi:predicted regulator of Ras-like GTPase activity (Roadblock/LC7/MglB family)